ncbi:MAG: outer membrane beta-barrel protein [Bacteroidales bacterium]
MNRFLSLFYVLLSIIAIDTYALESTSLEQHKKFDIGVHTGLDIGGAVPFPLSTAIGGDDKMDAIPGLTPSVGLSGRYRITDRWSLTLEGTYKTVSLTANIVTLSTGQQFIIEGNKAIFKGKASTDMRFTMFEIPLYAQFSITENNRVLLGSYCTYIVNGRFTASALQGILENPEDPNDIAVISPEAPQNQNFSSNLSKWDTGVILGYEYGITKRFNLSGRIIVGVKDIFKKGENYLAYSMLHMRGTVVVSFRLF